METRIRGRAIVLGDNIDTDQIYPGRFLAATDPEEIGSHCLSGIDEAIASSFPIGGVVVAGRNFGCGSSREHAVIALLSMGAGAVIASSFARIFYRNAINLGLPVIVCKDLSQSISSGDTVDIDMEEGRVSIEGREGSFECEKISGQALMILRAGGVKKLMRQRFCKEE